jgi:hypothetical protein
MREEKEGGGRDGRDRKKRRNIPALQEYRKGTFLA